MIIYQFVNIEQKRKRRAPAITRRKNSTVSIDISLTSNLL